MDWQSTPLPTPVVPAPVAWAAPQEKRVNSSPTLDLKSKYIFVSLGAALLFFLLLTIGFCSVPLVIGCEEFADNDRNISRTLFRINYYNGNVSLGQKVGIVSGATYTTNVDPLGWNGNPFTFIDEVEKGIMCNGVLINSEGCIGLESKIYATSGALPINQNLSNIFISNSISPRIITPGPIPFLSTSLTTLASFSLAAVSIAFILTGLQLTLPLVIKRDWVSLIPFAATFAPLLFICISFFCILSTLVPSLIPFRNAIAVINPILVNLIASFWTSFGSLWFGGAQTIFGLTFENELTQIPLQASCAVTPASLNYRALAVAFNFLAALFSLVFQNSFAQFVSTLLPLFLTTFAGVWFMPYPYYHPLPPPLTSPSFTLPLYTHPIPLSLLHSFPPQRASHCLRPLRPKTQW